MANTQTKHKEEIAKSCDCSIPPDTFEPDWGDVCCDPEIETLDRPARDYLHLVRTDAAVSRILSEQKAMIIPLNRVGTPAMKVSKWRDKGCCGIAGVDFAKHLKSRWEWAFGYAILPALGSDLAILDCDQVGIADRIVEIFPALRDTLRATRQVEGGSRDHIFFAVEGGKEALGAGGAWSIKDGDGGELVSLRLCGSYVVGAGSQRKAGKTGEPYVWRKESAPIVYLEVGQIRDIMDWISAQRAQGKRQATDRITRESYDASQALLPTSAKFQSIRCPFHDDENASATLNLESYAISCFAASCLSNDTPGSILYEGGTVPYRFYPRNVAHKLPPTHSSASYQKGQSQLTQKNDKSSHQGRRYGKTLVQDSAVKDYVQGLGLPIDVRLLEPLWRKGGVRSHNASAARSIVLTSILYMDSTTHQARQHYTFDQILCLTRTKGILWAESTLRNTLSYCTKHNILCRERRGLYRRISLSTQTGGSITDAKYAIVPFDELSSMPSLKRYLLSTELSCRYKVTANSYRRLSKEASYEASRSTIHRHTKALHSTIPTIVFVGGRKLLGNAIKNYSNQEVHPELQAQLVRKTFSSYMIYLQTQLSSPIPYAIQKIVPTPPTTLLFLSQNVEDGLHQR